MTSTTTSVQIPVGLDKEAFDRGIKELQDNWNKSLVNMNAALELMGKGWDLVAGGVSFAVGHLVEFSKASADAELAERRAFIAMNQRSKVTQEAFDKLKDFNAEMQRKAGIDGDDLLKVQGTLSALGVMPGKLEAATKATVGLSEATGKDLGAAAIKVAKDLEKGGTHLDLWASNVAIAEDRAKTLAGGLQLLDINLGDVQEALGSTVTQSSAAAEGMQALNEFVAELAELFSREDIRLAVDGFFREIAGMLAVTIDMTVGAIKAFRDLASEAKVNFSFALGADWVDQAITPTDILLDNLLEKAGSFSDRLAAISRGSAALVDLTAPKTGGAGGGGGKGSTPPNNIGMSFTFTGVDSQEAYQKNREKEQMQRLMVEANLHDQELKAKEKWDEQQLSYDRQANELRYNEQVAAYQRLAGATDKFNQDMVNIGVGGFATFFTGLALQISAGNVSVLSLLGQFLGTMASQVGSVLIATGTAAMAAGVLGTVAPVFGAMLGGPAAIGAGAGLIVAGGTLMGIGALLGGVGKTAGGGGGAGGTASASAPSPRTFATLASGGPAVGFSSQAGGTSSTTHVYNVRFERGVVVGRDEATLARELERIQRRGDRLRGGGRR